MLIGPDSFHEKNLKGKSESEILTVIRSLKKQIGHLKNCMEHPGYNLMMATCPDEATRIAVTRLYLEKAKEEYISVGGTYMPSLAERKADYFDINIEAISEIVFTIGGFHRGFETRTISLTNEHLYLDISHSIIAKPSNFHIPPDYPCTRAEFIDTLRDLHIGEWRSKYDLKRFGLAPLDDGIQWDLRISYNNGHSSVMKCGDNAYPYNFCNFKQLIGLED